MAQQSSEWAVVKTKPLPVDDPWAVKSSAPVTVQAPPTPTERVGGGYGVLADIGEQVGRFGSRLASNIVSPLTHPIETAKAVATAPYHIIKSHMDEAQKAFDSFKRGDRSEGTLEAIASIIPVIGPMADEWVRRTAAGEGPEVAADMTMFALPAGVKALPKGVRVAGKVGANPVEAEALRYVQSEGVPANVAAVTGNDAVKGAMQAAEKTTILGSKIGKDATAATQQGLATLGESLASKAGRGAPTTMLAAGEEAASSMTGTMKQLTADADAAYGKIRAAEARNGVTGVNVKAAKAQLKPVYDQLVRESKLAQPQGATKNALIALDRLMQAPDVVPLSVADGALGEIKAALRKSGESEPWSKGTGVLRSVVDALDKRVMETASVHKLDNDLKLGRAATARKYRIEDVLDGLGTEPAATVHKILGQKDKAVMQLREIRKYAPEAVGEMGKAYLDDLFDQAQKAGGFTKSDKLFAEWNKLGPATKRELFADVLKKNPDYLHNLDRLFLASKKLAENVNPSGSGAAAVNAARGALGASGMFNPKAWVMLGLYEMGGAATAAALRSPRIARVLTRGLTVPVASPAAKAAYLSSVAKAFQAEGLPVPTFAQTQKEKQ